LVFPILFNQIEYGRCPIYIVFRSQVERLGVGCRKSIDKSSILIYKLV
jgi:hypothetical protein